MDASQIVSSDQPKSTQSVVPNRHPAHDGKRADELTHCGPNIELWWSFIIQSFMA